MTDLQVGYAAMLEQFHPTEAAALSAYAESKGFAGVMAADHFQPVVPAKGQGAFVWNVLAALGERINRMLEVIGIIHKLFTASLAGRETKHSGTYFTLESTRAWTLPALAPEILVATAGPVTAKRAGRHADGLITVGARFEKIAGLFAKFEEGAREAGKDPSMMPRVLQLHLSRATTHEEALQNALIEWPNGGMKFPKADIRSPFEFDQLAKLVCPEDFEGRPVISKDSDVHRAQIQNFVDLGFDRIYLHHVGRNQREWIDVFATEVLPALAR